MGPWVVLTYRGRRHGGYSVDEYDTEEEAISGASEAMQDEEEGEECYVAEIAHTVTPEARPVKVTTRERAG